MRRQPHFSPLTAVLLLMAVASQISLFMVRGTVGTVSGDEGTFLAMTSSLALDGDLRFSESDAARLERAEGSGRKAVILQRTDAGISFSKPVLFAVLAAPWYRLLGEAGVVVINALALLVALLLGARVLQGRSGEARVGPVVATFAGTGVLASYVVWTMSDSLQASLVLGGGALALGLDRANEPGSRLDRLLRSRWGAAIGGLGLGLAAGMRFPNLLISVAPVIALFLTRRRARAAVVLSLVSVSFVASMGLNQILAGSWVPYKAVRATFNEETGYPVGDLGVARLEQFETARATHSMGAVPNLEPRTSAYATAYFFAGRHTGLVLYAPAALLFVWMGLRHRDPVSVCLVLAVAGLALFYLIWMPRNYFGGATFLGNRYFLTGYALLLIAPRRLPGRRLLLATWTVAVVVLASALWSSAQARDLDRSSQMHAYRGVFRLLPYESTAMDLDGRRDRYWSNELVRFVDPWAKVGKHGFKLVAGAPATELVTASGREHGVVRLLVKANVAEIDILYRDWGQRRRFRLKGAKGGAQGFLEITPSPTPRRHPYWWDRATPLWVRSMRLAARTPDGGPARVEVRYAGPYRFAPRFFRGELETLRLPSRATAGASRRVPIRVTNAGGRYWATDDPIPVFIGYRVFEMPRREDQPVAFAKLTGLPTRVSPGESFETRLELDWPLKAGRYEIEVDLVVAGIRRFQEWTGEALATRIVEVEDGHSEP